MPKTYIVKEGDCVSSIADAHGHFWQTVWNHPANARLKSRRRDPNTLVPGDVVEIPELRPKREKVATGTVHRFRKKGVPAIFRLQLFDDGEFRANVPFEFLVDGQSRRGFTSARGVIEVSLPPQARTAHLFLGEEREEYVIHIGNLLPIDELRGVQQRLRNLGYYGAEPSGLLDEPTQQALRAFQESCGLTASGKPDGATLDKLESLHDQVQDRSGPLKNQEDHEEEEDEVEEEAEEMVAGQPWEGG